MNRLAKPLAWSGVVALVVMTAALVGWRLHGGSWVRVETPSMGTRAPVGTLLWIEPVATADLRVGDLVTFRPPGSAHTYSHLVGAVHEDGTLSTHGAITGPDPWRITPDEVVGRAVLVWPGVGWLVAAAPVLVIGGFLVWLVVHRVRDRDVREPVAVLGAALVIATALVLYRPLLGAEQVSFAPAGSTARATYVGTGLLPVRLSASHGGSVVLSPGEIGGVTAYPDRAASQRRRFTVDLGPSIGWTWWVALVALCFAPAAITTIRPRIRRRAPAPLPVH